MINLFLWNFMQFFVSIIAALYLSWTVSGMITGLLFGWIIIIVIINYYFVLWRTPRLYAAQEIETRITGRTVDLLTNITAMKEYARRAYELTTLRTLIDMRRKAGIFNWRSSEGMRAVNSFVQAFFAAGMLYVAVTQFSAGKITVKAVFIPSSGHIRLVDL
jgi:ABC-type bacteriocin/lantibiotic exporter with double-glycine peptidase domain